MDYLALPFTLRKGYLARTDLEESIAHSIGLIISTRIGMMRFEPEYGCLVWDKEFSDLYSINKADIRANLRNAIGKFEGRLYKVSVSFSNISDSHQHVLGIVVKISGNYRDENKDEKKFEAEYQLG
jgi:phage baseplate assembly protein W